ncbi:hypothetical protein DVH24_035365 [Malus domestica]|uniref:Uncharacterized protein n=1 Tax=Malus domestica TaxID=3750 RepID=A0A498JB67_MALDO|nr:hypothetical protein DVH24_035365 [Malus domestica]
MGYDGWTPKEPVSHIELLSLFLFSLFLFHTNGYNPSPEVLLEVFPYLRVLKDGTIDRLAGTQVAHPGLDPETRVLSKDIVILPQTGVSAGLFRPITTKPGTKLPIFKPFTQTLFLSFQKTQNPSPISSSQHNLMPFHRHRRGNWPNQTN